MGRIYTGAISSNALTVQVDIFELLAGTGIPCYLHYLGIQQSTEVGDAQEEQLGILIKRGVGITTGSGGTATTPRPRDKNDVASAATLELHNTTKAVVGAGSFVNLEKITFNLRVGLDKWWTPDTRPRVHPADFLIGELLNTPADSVTFDTTVIFEEM